MMTDEGDEAPDAPETFTSGLDESQDGSAVAAEADPENEERETNDDAGVEASTALDENTATAAHSDEDIAHDGEVPDGEVPIDADEETAQDQTNNAATAEAGAGDGGRVATVYCVGFPDDLLERELANLCRFFPGYEGCSLLNNNRVGVTGFVKFKSADTAEEAIEKLNGIDYEGDGRKHVKAQIAKRELQLHMRKKPKTPRRRSEIEPRFSDPKRDGRDGRDRPRSPGPRERSPPRDRLAPRARSPARDARRPVPPAAYPRNEWDVPRYSSRDKQDSRRYGNEGQPPVARYDPPPERRPSEHQDSTRYSGGYERAPAPYAEAQPASGGRYDGDRRPHTYDPVSVRADARGYDPRYPDRPRADDTYSRGAPPARYDDPVVQPAEPHYDGHRYENRPPPSDSRYDTRVPPRAEPRYDDRGGDPRAAMGAKRPRYESAPRSSAPTTKDTLFVRGLDDQSNLEEIEQMFSSVPGYVTAKLQPTDRGAIAFVKFASEKDALAARDHMQGFVVQSEPLVVLNVEIAKRSLMTQRGGYDWQSVICHLQ